MGGHFAHGIAYEGEWCAQVVAHLCEELLLHFAHLLLHEQDIAGRAEVGRVVPVGVNSVQPIGVLYGRCTLIIDIHKYCVADGEVLGDEVGRYTTGINPIEAEVPSVQDYVYDVCGRCVASSQTWSEVQASLPRGIYLVNGKKIIKQ